MTGEEGVSVVIPVRDGAQYLAEALDSVLGQSVAPVEVIVVDDGSTDATPAVLTTYGGDVRVLRQAPSGYAAALNHGIAECRGTFIGFCDADDLWTANRLAAQLDALKADDALDLVGGEVDEFVSPDAHGPTGSVRVTGVPHRARLLQALLARRAVIERVGPFDRSLQHGAGIDWMSRADALGVRIGWVDMVVVRRRIHDANLGHDRATARTDLFRVIRRDRQRRASTSHHVTGEQVTGEQGIDEQVTGEQATGEQATGEQGIDEQ